MKFQIMHESKGRVRLRAMQNRMSIEQADLLESWLLSLPGVDQVCVHERICGVTIVFHGDRATLYRKLSAFSYEKAASSGKSGTGSSRAMNRHYKEKLISQVVLHFMRAAFLPDPLPEIR